MNLKMSFALLSTALMGTALVYGCSSSSSGTTPPGDDGGTTTDASTMQDAQTTHDAAAETSSSQCPKPGDVTGFTPPAYVPPHQMLGACKSSDFQTISDGCFATGHTKATCDAAKATVGTTCTGCIFSDHTATSWGPVVRSASGSVIYANLSGCMDLSYGSAGQACGAKEQGAIECEDKACGTVCPVMSGDMTSFQLYQACTNSSVMGTGGCSTFATAAATCEAALVPDGGADPCALRTAMAFTDFFAAIGPLFCGGGATDGGTDAGHD
jgi:hypothetical protein